MTLQQLLSTLNSVKVMAAVYDSDGKTLVTEIKTCTVDSLDDAIEARTVEKWEIVNNTAIKVILTATP